MGLDALQRGIAVTLSLGVALSGAHGELPQAEQRADEIRDLNRRALEQLPSGSVPSNGAVSVEAEVAPTATGQDVQLRQWQTAIQPRPTNAAHGLVVSVAERGASNAAALGLPRRRPHTAIDGDPAIARAGGATNAGVRVCAGEAAKTSAPDRIVNRHLPIDESKDSP